MSVQTWERLAASPNWYRDRYVAIEHFQDADGAWEIAENIVTEAACDGEPFDYFFFSMLVNTVPGPSLEADFGAGEYRRESRPGNMIFGDESSARKLQGKGPFHSITLYIRKEHFLSRASEIADNDIRSLEYLHTHAFRDDGLEVLVKALMQQYHLAAEATEMEEFKDAIVERLLLNARQSIAPLTGEDRLAPEAIRRSVDYLQANCQREVSRDELAAVAGVSGAHFSRLFRQTMGITPQRYLIGLRVERAKRLLVEASPDVALSAIAQQCGFADKSHLGREFRRLVGVTPGLYRKHR